MGSTPKPANAVRRGTLRPIAGKWGHCKTYCWDRGGHSTTYCWGQREAPQDLILGQMGGTPRPKTERGALQDLILRQRGTPRPANTETEGGGGHSKTC